MLQPTGHAHQMPVAPMAAERTKASATRSVRSVKVETMNCFIIDEPRSTPSATSLMEMIR